MKILSPATEGPHLQLYLYSWRLQLHQTLKIRCVLLFLVELGPGVFSPKKEIVGEGRPGQQRRISSCFIKDFDYKKFGGHFGPPPQELR